MAKGFKELPTLVKRARQRGFDVRGGTNGGGWFRLAHARLQNAWVEMRGFDPESFKP